MDDRLAVLLRNQVVRAELWRAWEDSNPGVFGGHEEGGFICLSDDGKLTVDRWPSGTQNQIAIPHHPDGKRNNEPIIATFHTHPNTSTHYEQEPNADDRFAVARDADLQTSNYLGEIVISKDSLYHILPDGNFVRVGETTSLLGETQNDE